MDLLAAYESSEDEEEKASSTPRLPVPSSIRDMFPQEQRRDDPSLHQGRVRSFEHERGQWAGLVSVEVGEVPAEWGALLEEKWQPLPSPLHLSLSRPLRMRHHWIQPLLAELRKRVAHLPPFQVHFGGCVVLENDEATRTFLAVEAAGGGLEAACEASDAAVASFGLPPFYLERHFHVSVGWTLGGGHRLRPPPPPAPANPLLVTALSFTAGNLTFSIPLAPR